MNLKEVIGELQRQNSYWENCVDDFGKGIKFGTDNALRWLDEISQLDIEEYQKASTRTINEELNSRNQVFNMVFGLNGEVGEVTDLLKKHYFHGHKLDKEHLKEELGDVMFYIVNLATLYDIDMSEVLQLNVDKLLKRYPNGFSEEDSINREV